jgi:hypothetical protein
MRPLGGGETWGGDVVGVASGLSWDDVVEQALVVGDEEDAARDRASAGR